MDRSPIMFNYSILACVIKLNRDQHLRFLIL